MTPSKSIFIAASWGKHGLHQYAATLAKELAARGYQVVVLVDHRKVEAENPTGNPAIYTWPSYRPVKWQDAVFLYRLIRRYRPVCLAAQFGAVNIGILISWLMGVRTRIAWYHTISASIDIDQPLPTWKAFLMRWRKQWIYRLCTHYIAVSETARADLVRTYGAPPHKVTVQYNTLRDPFEVNPSLSQIEASSKKLVCVGRLDNCKGQDVLIQAIAQLHSCPELEFEFIGDGINRELYEQQARECSVADRCVFTPAIPNQQVYARMAGAFATVVPSRYEAFGLVVIESLSVGTPVIGARVGGIAEIVRDGQDGLLFASEDATEMAHQIEALAQSPARRAVMSASARQRYLDHFELEKQIQQRADWFEQVLLDAFQRADAA